MTLLHSVLSHSCKLKDDVALENEQGKTSASGLLNRANSLSEAIGATGVRSIALYADNGPDWVAVDLACQFANVCLTPLPLFFSPEQIVHALHTSGAEILFCNSQPQLPVNLLSEPIPGQELSTGNLCGVKVTSPSEFAGQIPEQTAKITYTSGTTGSPKGVCLSTQQQLAVARSLSQAVAHPAPRHLCVLPMSTLLENIGGIYAPLLGGGTVVAPSLNQLGMTGSSELDLPMLLASISHWRPNSMILVPELLNALVLATHQGWCPPDSLAFVAVGGSRVAPELLRAARNAQLPVFEGYGLSECASVVTLNTPTADRPGSVGQVLPHAQIQIREGEIFVSGNAFLGYAGQPDSWNCNEVATGDTGIIDDEGFVTIDGRRKHIIISSFGRNISPEWVESEIKTGPLFRQVAVFGESRPHCVALLVPRNIDESSPERVDAHIEAVNQRLPDYAQVHNWHLLEHPFGPKDATATENGRLRRHVIEEKYSSVIDALYRTSPEVMCS